MQLLPLLTCLVASAADAPRGSAIGFLVQAAPPVDLGAERRAALDLARTLLNAVPLTARDDGTIADADGRALAVDVDAAVWLHQGDSVEQAGPLYRPKTIATLRAYVEAGGGLFLSGAALSMVHVLGIEPVNPRRGGPGNDRSPAGLVPLERDHPIFRGLAGGGHVVQISDAGYPAFADFHASGGPTKGMLLAKTPGGSENPLVEYELGKGRIIAMGWRLPHYSYAANPHRANLERLTRNILEYLADASQWQKVVVKPVPGPKPKFVRPGVPDGQFEALDRAIHDLAETFDDHYSNAEQSLQRLRSLEAEHKELLGDGKNLDADRAQKLNELAKEFRSLQREALLANPLLDFDRLLLVKRGVGNLGLPQNWQSNSSLARGGYDNEIAVLSMEGRDAALTTLFRPENGGFVGDVDLHFDATKMLFSLSQPKGPWRVMEINADGSGLRTIRQVDEPDVDNYDACYLPDGNVIFTSTAPFVGVPCVTGSSHVSNLFLLDTTTGAIRQLGFEQDHDWCPTVLNNGRVLYLRWEYSDIPHFVSRLLFSMNPDGSDQKEFYGSNSYWPNAMFYARPIPADPTKFVAVVGGHHDRPRMGELVLFDTARGRHEADGAIQRIPGYGKRVEPIILDGLTANSWPKFLHPYPLSDKYFLVAAQPTAQSLWGIYLVDVFDNMVLLKEEPGYALLEPIPLRPTKAPPAVRGTAKPGQKDALVYMADVYAGPGLKGVPRGTVKKLRLFTYHFAYHGMGGQVNRVGLDGPWDIKRIMGTVPVEPDGSAFFRVPANVPVSVQPLDAEGKALQLMRSWMTAMPGETLSCVGCHEQQDEPPPVAGTLASTKPPTEIAPWYGPTRGFSFKREVQPVLDAYCVRCHNGRAGPGGQTLPDFRPAPPVHPQAKSANYNNGTQFTPSYLELRRFVRSTTIESDMHLLPPGEFHADTTRLVQLLRAGHNGVRLDAESWDRLITWIDLGTPAHGTWHEIVGEQKVNHQRDRRRAMLAQYAGIDEDPEEILDLPVRLAGPETTIRPNRLIRPIGQREQPHTATGPTHRTLDLGGGVTLQLTHIPAEPPFWLGTFEITNEQFAQFDPTHDSRLEHGDFLQFSVLERGYPLNAPKQPVCRVSWQRAMDFCRWLSEKTGEQFTLPTEAQWEHACRAGTSTPLWYGDIIADFKRSANLADASLRHVDTLGWSLPSGAVPEWRPAIASVDDGHRVSAPVGSYEPNPWGLYDMHGNVAEWTLGTTPEGRKVVRGGSWYDRPKHATSACRASYAAWLGVYDVGFRVVSVSP